MGGKGKDWYAARVLFRSRLDGVVREDALYEERIVLLRAACLPDAEAKAHRYGIKEGHEYRNEQGQLVTWELHSVSDAAKVEAPQDDAGWDVWSRFLRESELVDPPEEG